jgi:hypothetical protein
MAMTRNSAWLRRGRKASDDVDFDLDVSAVPEREPETAKPPRQPTVWDDPRIDSKAMLMSLYGIARRVYRLCWVVLASCALLSLFGLVAPRVLSRDDEVQDARFWLKMALYIGLFIYFGWLIVGANYAMEGLERRAQFKPNLKPWSLRGPEPDAYDVPAPLQPILVIRREGSNAPVPTVGDAARRQKIIFGTVFAATPALTFLPDVLRSGDRALALSGLALWCYFCYVAARDGLYVLDTWIDEHLTGRIEGA